MIGEPKSRCRDCGALLPPQLGHGRPWVRCRRCAADTGVLARAWRQAHPEAVTAYDYRRSAAARKAREARAFARLWAKAKRDGAL